MAKKKKKVGSKKVAKKTLTRKKKAVGGKKTAKKTGAVGRPKKKVGKKATGGTVGRPKKKVGKKKATRGSKKAAPIGKKKVGRKKVGRKKTRAKSASSLIDSGALLNLDL